MDKLVVYSGTAIVAFLPFQATVLHPHQTGASLFSTSAVAFVNVCNVR